MNIHYCLPIIKKTKAEVLETIRVDMNDYDIFEVWLDYIVDNDISFVRELMSHLNERLILLFRRQQLETIQMSLQERKSIIALLENTGTLLDIDVKTQQEELDYITENKLNIQFITSYHNYTETPDSETIQDIITEMAYYTPAIYKIATFCQTEQDAVVLLQTLLTLKQQGKKAIILGMGEKGSVTRTYGSLWGNEMIFAPKEKNENSAPGQLTKEELATIFKILVTRN